MKRNSPSGNKLFIRTAGAAAIAAVLMFTVLASPLHADAGRIRRASGGSGDDAPPPAASDMIKAGLLRQYNYEYDDDLGTVLDIYHDEIILPEETRDKYPDLARTTDGYNKMFEERTIARTAELTETLNMIREGEYPFYGPLMDHQEIYIRRADPACFSVVRYEETYDGGVHGYYSYFGLSADPVTGASIGLKEVVNDITVLPGILEAELAEHYPDTHFSDLQETFESYTEIQQYDDGPGQGGFNWCLDPQGITFFFSPYEIASYADGAMEVTLLFEEYPEIFTGIYGASREGFVLNFPMFEKITYDAGGDGIEDTLMVTAYPDEYDTYSELSLFINGEEYIDDEIWAFDIRPVLMHTDDGRVYLYVEMTSENDYMNIEVYDLSGEEPEYAGRVDGGFAAEGAEKVYSGQFSGSMISAVSDPDDFGIEKRTQLMSTMNCTMRCGVNDTGLPEGKEKYWTISGSGITFTLKQDTSFDRVDESGKVTGKNSPLAKGTRLYPCRTDDSGFVDAKTGDGTIYRIYVDTENGWPRIVNGVELEELFDGIIFAG